MSKTLCRLKQEWIDKKWNCKIFFLSPCLTRKKLLLLKAVFFIEFEKMLYSNLQAANTLFICSKCITKFGHFYFVMSLDKILHRRQTTMSLSVFHISCIISRKIIALPICFMYSHLVVIVLFFIWVFLITFTTFKRN